MSYFVQLLVIGLAVGGVYALIALGFVIIYKGSGLFNVAQGEIVMLGAMFCYMLAGQLGLPFILAVILTLVASVGIGYLLERTAIRPMIGQPILAIIMLTIGLAAIFRGIGTIWIGPELYSYPMSLPNIGMTVGKTILPSDHLWAIIITILTTACLMMFFRVTKMGLAMRATADNSTASQAAGIKVRRVYGASWAMACAAGSMGGIVLGILSSINFMLSASGLASLSAAVVGGFDSIPGTVIGGLIVGVLQSLVGGYWDRYIPGIKEAAPYVILLAILLVRPYGLFGLKQIERV